MSAQSAPERATCSYCDGERDPQASVAGSFCSTKCYHRHKGADILNSIRSDHTVCPSCFSRIKEVERPDESDLVEMDVPRTIRDVFVGYQFETPRTDYGEDDYAPEESSSEYTDPAAVIRRKWSCECGTTFGSEPDETLERVEGDRVIKNLLLELGRRYIRGELDRWPSTDAFFDALREEGRDYELAIGKALYGGEP